MKALELRRIDKQRIEERCYVKSHPCRASSRLITIKMLAAILAGSLWIPGLAFSEDDKMGQMPTPAPMQSPQAGQMNIDAIAGKLAELQNQLRRVETMLQERSQHPGGMNTQGQGMQGNMNAFGAPPSSSCDLVSKLESQDGLRLRIAVRFQKIAKICFSGEGSGAFFPFNQPVAPRSRGFRLTFSGADSEVTRNSKLWVRQMREKVIWAKSYRKPRFIVIIEMRSARRLGSHSRSVRQARQSA
jgi:hypothetical protein